MSRPTFDQGFSTAGLTAVYTPEATVAAMLEFEAALALALADVGIAPREEAEELAAACRKGVTDPETVLESTWEDGTPVIALRDRITDAVGTSGQWFHFGATTQDAVDTGQMIQARTALGVIGQGLERIARRLSELTKAHRDHPQMGRTFHQDALATTFGFRTAGWLDSVLTHLEELRGEGDAMCVQLGGPVGTGAGYGDAAATVTSCLAERLHLRSPDISWHTDRTRILSLAHALERTAATMAKIGSDLALLSSSYVAELSVRSGGSSSIPGKKNPLDAIRAVAAASACAGAVGMLSTAPPHELDRAVGSWHVEWLALPLSFQTAGASVEAIQSGLDSLEVEVATMARRVDAGGSPTPQIDGVLERFNRIVTG